MRTASLDVERGRIRLLAGLVAAVAMVLGACSGDIRAGKGGSDDVLADAGGSFDADVRDTGPGDTDHADGDEVDGHDADAADADGGFRRGPPYPIVFAHGFGGFEHLADVEQLPYFYKIPEALRRSGENVLVTEVDPFSDSYRRGQQLLEQIEAFTDEQRWEKVHIIGHSQGGLDARYVAHHRPERVASVVTISSPNRGTRVADITLRLTDSDMTKRVIDEVSKLLGRALYDESGEKTGAVDALEQFAEPGIEEFNEEITDQPGVYYASVAGRTDRDLGGRDCNVDDPPDFIEDWKFTGDPVDPILSVTESVLDGPAGTRSNDGMVSVENSKWGDFLGCIPADHFDEVGQLVGDEPGAFNDWDYIEFYEKLVAYLHDRE